MGKFIAWDKFKQKSIKSKVKDKKSIPSALRKIFVSRLVMENSEAVKNDKTPVFSSLIRVQWALQSQQFTPWLTGILPQLGVWFNRTTGLSIDNILDEKAEQAACNFTDEDKDMFVLAHRYAQFLGKHNFFEPAWETPPFNNDGLECFIFFPEALSDFCEYRELLEESAPVKIISASVTEDTQSHTFFYTNVRREITEAALYIRALHEKQGIRWDSIAVCFPDSESYEPYVMREFTNRNIPFVKRTSKPLTDFPAGRFFRSVMDCTSQDFAFSQFTDLVLNKNLPWKNTEAINNLVNFGIKNNCINSWTEEKDDKEKLINVWEDAFKNPFGYLEPDSRRFFNDLKKHLYALRRTESFAEIRKQYFIFRELFFKMEECSAETDLILSRCIAELMELTELEKNYPDIPAVDPFLFLTEYLTEVNYLAQAKTSGAAILPYKTAASAPFDCHIILGAGQGSMSVVYSKLYFLPKKKREELGIKDEDASDAFINFHKFNSLKRSAFFCSEQTFSGYEIPHSKIGASLKSKENYTENPDFADYFSKDYYRMENESQPSENFILHENQINGFNEWKNRRKEDTPFYDKSISNITLKYIQKKLAYNNKFPGKNSVSASSLKTYYECSLKWLFNRILNIENAEIETSLMAEDLTGTVYHAALDLFFSKIKEKNELLLKPLIADNGPALPVSYNDLLQKCINKIFDAFPLLATEEKRNSAQMSSLTSRFLFAAKDQFVFNLSNCIAHFLSIFAGCKVKSCETWYQSQRENYYLNGKSDCILEDNNGNCIIIDFKLGSPPKRKDCTGEGSKGLCDFQLPMYITLAEENERIEIHNALFFSIIKSAPEVIIGSVRDEIYEQNYPKKETDIVLKSGELYNQILKEFELKTNQFAEEITTGNFTIFETDYNECNICSYSRICRKVYTIKAEKNISLGKF